MSSIFECMHGDRTKAATKSETKYALIPEKYWSYPAWVTPEDAAAAREKMAKDWVLYGARESYHHMCRFFSGFIHKMDVLAEYDYYWRMEPDVHYYCDLGYDPFLYMQVCCTSSVSPEALEDVWYRDEQRQAAMASSVVKSAEQRS